MSLPGRFVDTRAGRVFVHRQGRGQPLLLVHGYGLSHFTFRAVVPALAETHEVVAIDLPGFGESDRPAPERYDYDFAAFADTVAEVMDALALPRATVLGSSMGGGVALTLAARQPARVARLVLVGALVYPVRLPPEGRLLFTPRLGQFLWHYVVRRADIRRLLQRDSFRDPRFADDDFVDYYWARFNRAGGREAAYAALLAITRLSEATSDPGLVTAPTLLVWGEEDRQVPLAHGKRLSRAIAGAKLSVVPASGHLPYIERPDEFLRQVLPFCAGPCAERRVGCDEDTRPIAEAPPVPAHRSAS